MIRSYEKDDLAELLEVWYTASVIAHPFLDESFFAQERKSITQIYLPRAETWVFEKDGCVVGFVSLIEDEIGGIFVKPQLQGQGIGQELMDHACKLRSNLEVEVFEANSVGRRFYDKYGFKCINKYVCKETGFELLRLKIGC